MLGGRVIATVRSSHPPPQARPRSRRVAVVERIIITFIIMKIPPRRRPAGTPWSPSGILPGAPPLALSPHHGHDLPPAPAATAPGFGRGETRPWIGMLGGGEGAWSERSSDLRLSSRPSNQATDRESMVP